MILKFLTFLALGLLCLPSLGYAQQTKHSRVIELEAQVQDEIKSIFRARFPNEPIIVTVDITPLRRPQTSRPGTEGEHLPYYEAIGARVVDEWDDPAISNFQLMGRVQKAEVRVLISDEISEAFVAEIKDSIMSGVKLIPGRDDLTIVRKAWGTSQLDLVGWMLSLALIVLGLSGMYFILKLNFKSLGSVVSAPPSEGAASSAQGPVDFSLPKQGFESSETFKVSDTFKVRELTRSGVEALSQRRDFPSLKDMILLEELGERSPGQLGALLSEFSVETQERLFGYSFSEAWLEALSEPGELSNESLKVVERLLQLSRNELSASWEELLILVWRLGSLKSDFFRKIKKEEGFSLLNALPQSISLQAGREAFPGAWAVLLEDDFTPIQIKADRIRELSQIAREFYPLRSQHQLRQFKKDRELLKYLKVAETVEEKEIYEAAPKSSMIHEFRKPFYKVLEQDDSFYTQFVDKFSLDQWAVALFNVPRDMRKSIESQFSEKERFLYIQRLKSFDKNPPEKEVVGSLREVIASYFSEYLIRHEERADKKREDVVSEAA